MATFKISISDEILAEIGKITVTFSLIELSLAEIIGKIVTIGNRVHQVGVILTADMSFRHKLTVLNSLLLLAFEKDSPTYVQFTKVEPLLKCVELQRNTVVHSVWGEDVIGESDQVVVRMKWTAKPKQGLRSDFVVTSIEELRRISLHIGEAYAQLCLFELQFHDETVSNDS